MTTTPKVLIPMQDMPSVQTIAYTSPTGGKGTWIDQFDVTNYDTVSAYTFKVWIVPSGSGVSNSNLRVFDKSVGIKNTLSIDEVVGTFLNPGDAIVWQAFAPIKLNGGASGREIT